MLGTDLAFAGGAGPRAINSAHQKVRHTKPLLKGEQVNIWLAALGNCQHRQRQIAVARRFRVKCLLAADALDSAPGLLATVGGSAGASKRAAGLSKVTAPGPLPDARRSIRRLRGNNSPMNSLSKACLSP